MNEFMGFANCYDLLMTSGYYNYEKTAKAIADILPPHSSIIEVGVGTGLLLEQLLEVAPQSNFTGMDRSPKMLEVAKKRLGDRLQLIEADMVSMSIPDRFDVAISHGGGFLFIDRGSNCDFYTSILEDEPILQALQNIANCLHKDGLLLINIQGEDVTLLNYEKTLPGGIVYSQELREVPTKADWIAKYYYFKTSGSILEQDRVILRRFQGKAIDELMKRSGFNREGKDESGLFFVYSKK